MESSRTAYLVSLELQQETQREPSESLETYT